MKFRLAFVLCFGVILNSYAENTVVMATAISDVVVYPSGAQITRNGNVQLQTGTADYVIKNISPTIDVNSIQLVGNGDYTILSVIHKYNYTEEKQKTSELQMLQQRLDSVENALSIENAHLSAYTETQNMMIKNQYIGGSNVGIKTTDLKEAEEFHLAKMTELNLKKVDVNANINKLNDLKSRIELQSNEVKSKITKVSSEIWVSISSTSAQKTKLSLTYFEPSASWKPFYDIRVKDVNEPLVLNYKAKITQNSGEDWKDVHLTLSTSEPKTSAQMPFLDTWYLYFNNYNYKYTPTSNSYVDLNSLPQYTSVSGKVIDQKGETLIGVNVTAKNTTIGTVTDIDGYFTLQIPNGVKQVDLSYVGYKTLTVPIASQFLNLVLEEEGTLLEDVVVTAMSIKREKRKKYDDFGNRSETNAVDVDDTQTPVDINFVIKNPYTINSNNRENVVDIKSEEINATYKYFSIPKLDKSVFLTANIANWEDLNLIAGEANLYFQNTYTGRSLVNPAITDDTLMLSLGRDKNIIVSREKNKDFSKKQFLSGDRIVQNAFIITIRNNKKQPIDLTIYDQIPVSKAKEIHVDLTENDYAGLEEETGKLTWKMLIEPTVEKKMKFGYTVKYPKNKTVFLKE